LVRAKKYETTVTGMKGKLVDYYIEAEDSLGNVARSPIMHVYVGTMTGGSTGNAVVSWQPLMPTIHDTIMINIKSTKGGWLHWGVDQWTLPHAAYWPAGSTVWSDNKAIESPLTSPDSTGTMRIRIGPFDQPAQIPTKISFVVHYADNSWDNNGGKDYFIPLNTTGVSVGSVPKEFVLEQNYPNPFNPETVIGYWLVVGGEVSLQVFDLLGREVAVLVDGMQTPGMKTVRWNAGVYYCRLSTNEGMRTRTMLLLK
jgi:hypothetical protein